MFSGVKKWCIGKEWVNKPISTLFYKAAMQLNALNSLRRFMEKTEENCNKKEFHHIRRFWPFQKRCRKLEFDDCKSDYKALS